MDFKQALGMIQDYAKYAVEAINDEHEGNFKHFVNQMNDLSAAVKSAADNM